MNTRTLTLSAAGLALVGLGGCQTTAPSSEPMPTGVERSTAQVGPDVVDARTLTFPALGEVNVPEVRRATLSNGVEVYLVEDRSLPLVRAQARVGVGSLADPSSHVGLADVAAQAMRSGGAGALDADALNLALESVGASVEAYAGDDATTVAMQALEETVDTVLPLFAAVLAEPRFAEEQVELAKTQQKAGIARRNDNPQQIATREMFQALYGEDSPEARVPEYWTIDAISPDDARAWHARHVAPANTRLAVWGDFDADEMIDQLEAALGRWETPPDFEPTSVPATPTSVARRVLFVEKPDVNQSTVLIGHAGAVRRDHPDYPALLVLNEILGGGFSSRLYKTIRSDLGFAYAVFGNYSADYDEPGVFYSGTFTKSESTLAAADAMLDVIRSMQTTPPSEAELALAKEAYLNSFVFNYDTKGEVLGRRLTYDTYGYPADHLERVREGVEAVTAADVQRVAREYLRPDEATILVLGNPADFDRPVSSLGEVETVDIAIPTTPPGEAAASGDAEAGAAALDAVAEALGGAARFDALDAFRTQSTTEVSANGQTLSIEGETAVRLPDQVRVVQRLPMGEITVVLDGQSAQILTPAGPQPAPPQIVEQLRSQLYLSLPYLLARRDDAEVEALADGALQVRVPGVPAPYRIALGADGRPVSITTTQITPGGPAEVVVTLGDYREVGGLTLPYRYTQTQGGEPSGETVISEMEINPDLADGLFSVRG